MSPCDTWIFLIALCVVFFFLGDAGIMRSHTGLKLVRTKDVGSGVVFPKCHALQYKVATS